MYMHVCAREHACVPCSGWTVRAACTMLEWVRRGIRSLVCKYRNLLIWEEASRSRTSSSCTMNTWRDSGCSSSSLPGATGPGSAGYTSCWKLTCGVDGGLSGRRGWTGKGAHPRPLLSRPNLSPTAAATWTPPHSCATGTSDPHGHDELECLPRIHLPPVSQPSRHPSGTCPPITLSANVGSVLPLQSLYHHGCQFCFLRTSLQSLCTSVTATAAPGLGAAISNPLPGTPARPLQPLSTHPEGSL